MVDECCNTLFCDPSWLNIRLSMARILQYIPCCLWQRTSAHCIDMGKLNVEAKSYLCGRPVAAMSKHVNNYASPLLSGSDLPVNIGLGIVILHLPSGNVLNVGLVLSMLNVEAKVSIQVLFLLKVHLFISLVKHCPDGLIDVSAVMVIQMLNELGHLFDRNISEVGFVVENTLANYALHEVLQDFKACWSSLGELNARGCYAVFPLLIARHEW